MDNLNLTLTVSCPECNNTSYKKNYISIDAFYKLCHKCKCKYSFERLCRVKKCKNFVVNDDHTGFCNECQYLKLNILDTKCSKYLCTNFISAYERACETCMEYSDTENNFECIYPEVYSTDVLKKFSNEIIILICAYASDVCSEYLCTSYVVYDSSLCISCSQLYYYYSSDCHSDEDYDFDPHDKSRQDELDRY
jgi:hypothetical protein